jgi:iron complex transport system substrate-binding protein
MMRVISLLASGTEIVCGLGAGDSLVGRSHECDNPAWVLRLPACSSLAFEVGVSSGQIDSEVRRRLRVGEPLYNLDTGLIRRLKPDLVITQSHCQVCAVTPADVERSDGAVAGQVLALQAGSLNGIYEGIRRVASAMDLEQNGNALIRRMTKRIDTVTEAVRGRPGPTVVVLEWTDPIFAAGNWMPQLVEAANGNLLLAEKGKYSSAIAWEQVREADPEYLIIAPCGFGLDRAQEELRDLERLPGWFKLTAARQGRVAVADGNKFFNRSGVTVAETVEIIAEIIHGHKPQLAHHGTAWRMTAAKSSP